MTLEQLIEQARSNLADLLTQRSAATEALAQMRDNLGTDESITEQSVTDAIAARDAFDSQIQEARSRVEELEAELARDNAAAELARQFVPAGQRGAGVVVGNEPTTYRENGEHSYFRDLWLATAYGRRDSMERLHRNDSEVRAIGTADTAGGEFVPPVWLVDKFEDLARAGRVIADRVDTQPLPAGTDSISLPRITTGPSVAEQTTQGNALSETDMVTTSTTGAVATLGGVETVNIQLVEQSPINIDNVVLRNLAEEYAKQVDVFVISNNGTNKVGLLNVSGINSVTYTDASPTVQELWPKLADAIQQIHSNRFLPAEEIYMHPRRWAWLLATLDSNGRPFVSDVSAAAVPLLGTSEGAVAQGFAGTLRGVNLPVFLDANIPTNLGSGTNEDRIIVARPKDVTLFESKPKAEAFRETKAKEAQVVFRMYGYLALLSGRAPKSISVISGTGLVTPTF